MHKTLYIKNLIEKPDKARPKIKADKKKKRRNSMM